MYTVKFVLVIPSMKVHHTTLHFYMQSDTIHSRIIQLVGVWIVRSADVTTGREITFCISSFCIMITIIAQWSIM